MSRDKEKDKKKGFWKTLFRPKNSPSPTAPLSRKKSGTVTSHFIYMVYAVVDCSALPVGLVWTEYPILGRVAGIPLSLKLSTDTEPQDVEDDGDPPPPRPRRRLSDSDVVPRKPSRLTPSPTPRHQSRTARKLHKRHNSAPAPPKGKNPQVPTNGHAPGPYDSDSESLDGAMPGWPPRSHAGDAELPLGHAMDLICKGVPVFRGHRRRIPHATETFYSTYATVAGNRGADTDGVNQHDSMTQLMTMRTMGPGRPAHPWATVEQPSYCFYFGRLPGTVTLNQWATTASVRPGPIALRDSGVTPREVDLVRVFGRLKDLELGLEDDDIDYMYKNLYRRFLKDPDRLLSPHKGIDKQITDLILILTRPGHWIDFSNPKNQIVTRFIFDTAHVNHDTYLKFFHQLLLSMELDLRIHSKQHSEWAKEKLLEQLPPALRWNLALSRRWRENVRIEAYGSTADQVKLRYKLKRRQVKMIKRFAQMMKWPNLADTLASLRQGYEASNLDAISSHAMAFFSGLVLPGPSFPFILMNSLIDIDPDEATDDLALLIHLNPNCGFQYRSSYTYWTSSSIVGKVLAPTCHEVAGWVGPARPTPDLKRSQIARIRSRRPRQRLTVDDVRSMAERSDPLGPPSEAFPVGDYDLVMPDVDDIVDEVRIELLTMKPCVDRLADPGPKWFDAAIQFAIDGVSWPLRLTYDVSFISAWPCTQGPHPLFYDYTFLVVKADEVISIRDWARLYGTRSRVDVNMHRAMSDYGDDAEQSASDSPTGEGSSKPRPAAINANDRAAGSGVGSGSDHEDEKVLVIEAFGVPDNEVLARAWCAHWGLSAIVADIGKTCMACAIREAYAAALNVVILVDDQAAYYTD